MLSVAMRSVVDLLSVKPRCSACLASWSSAKARHTPAYLGDPVGSPDQMSVYPSILNSPKSSQLTVWRPIMLCLASFSCSTISPAAPVFQSECTFQVPVNGFQSWRENVVENSVCSTAAELSQAPRDEQCDIEFEMACVMESLQQEWSLAGC